MTTDTAGPIPDTPDHCRRCGTCCLKGGPVLHREDLDLVRRGHIPLKDLVTICPGERVHDNVKDRLGTIASDRIKIQSRESAPGCRYYEPKGRGCAIYAHRPIQCRTLECWDTAAAEALYQRDHLSRRDLLGDVPGLWDLVEAHMQKCDMKTNARRAERILAGTPDAMGAEADLLESLRYDQSLRDLIASRGRPAPNLLPFLLGRPLTERLRALRLKLIHAAGQYRLTPL